MRPTDIRALNEADAFDICIIGAGFAGTVIGIAAAESGARTIVLESGHTLVRWLVDKDLKELAAYDVSGQSGYPTTKTKARALGGNSNFWTGRCERFHPSDFSRHPYSPPENPWPVDYQELEPYYQRADQTLRVRGEEPTEFAPPRSSPFPLPSRSDISSLRAILSTAGVEVDGSPTATPRKALRFFRLPKELLPRFYAAPTGLPVTGVTVTRLLVDEDGAVDGVEAKTMDGTTKIVRAKIYVVACGGIETPRLLLLSRSDPYPEGLGNRHDRVGRGFNEHPGVNFYASLKHDRNTLSLGHRIGRTHMFYDRFRSENLGSVFPVFIQSWVFPNHLITPRLRDLPAQAVGLLKRIARPTLYAGATIEMAPLDSNRVTLSDRKDRFGNPLAHLHLDLSAQDQATLERVKQLIREVYSKLGATGLTEGELTWSRHHIGTCRMGDDPKTSVVDRDLRVHDCRNLYLCGSETFVTGAAVPPVATIVALAHRLSDHLLERLSRG